MIGPNALLKRTIVGIAVSFLWLANVVYASGGDSSPGGPGLPDEVQYPLRVLHGSLYVGTTLQDQPQPNWWLVDLDSSQRNKDGISSVGAISIPSSMPLLTELFPFTGAV